MKSLIIKANLIDVEDGKRSIVEKGMTIPPELFTAIRDKLPPELFQKQFGLRTYHTPDCKFQFFIDDDTFRIVDVYIEDRIREAMVKTDYDDALRFRKLKEVLGEKLVADLSDKLKKIECQEQLKRALEF